MHLRFLLPSCVVLAAAAAEDAGRVRQTVVPPPVLPETGPVMPGSGTEEPPAVAALGTSFLVRQITILGNHILTADEVTAVTAAYAGRALDERGLAELAAALRFEYRSRGYFLTEVYIPPQAAIGGELTVLVSEGYLAEDGLDIENTSRAPTVLLRDVLATAAKPGAVFRRDRIERALLLLEDMPGVTAEHEIVPGGSVGEGRLRTAARDSGLLHGEVDGDNFGSYPTGTWRLGATVDVEGLAGRGDRLRLRGVVASEALVQGEFDASCLATASGTRLGAGIVYLDFAQKRELSVLDAKGRSLEVTARVSHPIERSLERTQRLILRASWLDLRDEQAGQDTLVRRIPSATLEYSGDWTVNDDVTTWILGLRAGSVDLSGSDAYAAHDADGAQTAGGFARCELLATHRRRLGGQWSATAEMQAQVTSGNLDSSQQFAIGGPYSMAGYPVAEIVADQGVRGDLSIGYHIASPPWRGDCDLSLGYQAAWAQLHADTWDGWEASGQGDNTVVVQSAYFGVEQTWPVGVLLRGQIGWRWQENPVRDPQTGLDTDFSDDRLRVWIQAVYYF